MPFDRLELDLYDLAYKLRGKTDPPGEIAIIAIDDKSLRKFGRWPWDRGKIVSIVDSLRELGPKVVFLDVFFSEPDGGDGALAEAIERSGNIVLPLVFENLRPVSTSDPDIRLDDVLYDSAIPMIRNMENMKIHPPLTGDLVTPVEILSRSARALGHINMDADEDGTLRSEVMAVECGGEFFPSADLQVARLYLDLPMEAVSLRAGEGLQLHNLFIPTNFQNRMLIHYYGPHKTFPYFSVTDVLERKVDPSRIRDKIILVGATAMGIYDLRVTPASSGMPGVEKHANVIASILQRMFVQKADNLTNVLLVFLSGIVFSSLMMRAKALSGALAGFVFVSSIIFSGYFVFYKYGLWVDMSYSSINILFVYLAVTAFRYTTEEYYAKKVRAMFSSYVTERVVNELIKNPDLAKLGGERREITVLFSDIRGFTTFSEQHTPEEVVAQLNEYLAAMSEVIFKWEGTLDKYIGDAIVAFWGAPVPQEDHAERAIRCALEMGQRLGELQKRWRSEGKTPFVSGVGINTGEVLVGNIGSEGKKMDYTVIGDQVNLGARVESLTKRYHAPILITEYTLDRVRGLVECGGFHGISVRGVEKVIVKGREDPVTLYEVGTVEDKEWEIIECEETTVRRLSEK